MPAKGFRLSPSAGSGPGGSLAFADLTDYPVNAAGVLTNDGTGNLSWAASGSADWGSIGAGTGVASQADLVTYLGTNFVPYTGANADLDLGVHKIISAIGRFTTGIYDNAGTPKASISPANRYLYYSDGSTVSVGYGLGATNDNTGKTSLSWLLRKLYDSNGDSLLYWNTAGKVGILNPTPSYELDVTGTINASTLLLSPIGRFTTGIYDNAGTPVISIDTGNRTLKPTALLTSLDWANRALYDTGANTTIDWQLCQLLKLGTLSLDWAKRQYSLVSPATDTMPSGIYYLGTAGENLIIGNLVYIKSDGKYWKAKGNSATTVPAVGIATETINADNPGSILKYGFLRNDAWNWTVGGVLYVSEATGGLITQTKPATSGNQVQIVGYALSATVIFFNPNSTIVEIA